MTSTLAHSRPSLRAARLPAPGTLLRRARGTWRWSVAVLVAGDLLAVAVAMPAMQAPASTRCLAFAPVGYALLGVNRPRLTLSWLADLPRLLLGALLPFAVLGLFASERLSAPHDPLVGIGVLLAGRLLTTAALREARRRGRFQERTLVVGAGALGQQLAARLLADPLRGLRPVGFLDDEPVRGGTTHLAVLGRPADLVVIAEALRVRTIVVAFGRCRDPELVSMLRAAASLRGTLLMVPRLYELGVEADRPEEVWGTPLVRVRRSGVNSPSLRAKRDLDVAVAALGLLLAVPLLLLVIPFLRRETGGSWLFAQERIGLDGEPFTLYKLRTLAAKDPTEGDVVWSIAGDERLGRLGALLRATSLDELPQLWNVLRGDMSIVGPRPERPYFVQQFSTVHRGYGDRNRMPVGITGLAQVNGLRGATSIEDRARFDNAYIEHWSLWLDVRICCRTVGQVLRRGGG